MTSIDDLFPVTSTVRDYLIDFAALAAALLLAVVMVLMMVFWGAAEAHTPCGIDELWKAPEPEPREATCGYVNSVNPLTGVYEATYVCK